MARRGELTAALLQPSSGQIPGSTLLYQPLAYPVLGPELQAQSPKKAGNTQPRGALQEEGPATDPIPSHDSSNSLTETKVRTRRETAKNQPPQKLQCEHRVSVEAAQPITLASLPPPSFLSQLAYAHTSTCLMALES